MDPNGNRIIVQLINTCFICRRMYVTARDLNQHLQQDHDLPIERYNRHTPPLHIEMIPTTQYIFLNMLAPNFDTTSHFAVFVTLRHACSLCHSHYPTLERLFRHMEAHFRAETPQEQALERRELDLSYEFFDTHHFNYNRPNEAAPRQQQDVADAVENGNGGFHADDDTIHEDGFQTDDATVNEESFHADDEGSDRVEEEEEEEYSDQQDSGHATSGVDSQNSIGNDRSEETTINGQQEFDPQHLNSQEEERFINNDHGNINLNPVIDAGNADLNGQPIIGRINPQERADQGSESNNNATKFIHWEKP